MPRIVPDAWMPDCRMERIITHWTGGVHHAGSGDREHYHVLIESDGRLVRGDHMISDNVSTAGDDYAQHVRMMNTGSIGIAACSMAGAMQRPFRAGRYPMNAAQYEVMAVVAADLCERYHIPVALETVLGHGEVESALSVPQGGKWDPMVLPWDPQRPAIEVGAAFRAMVGEGLGGAALKERLFPVRVIVDGLTVSDEGLLKGGAAWCPLRPLADFLGWIVLRIGGRATTLRTGTGDCDLAAIVRGDRGYVKISELCAMLGWQAPAWDAATRTVRVRSSKGERGSR
ncbi:MAG: N-acetylmuramoyl-L-alanine amidase [bacterium]|nr:N-acetylmuramoyl-L-alanine amidase [bacterium]